MQTANMPVFPISPARVLSSSNLLHSLPSHSLSISLTLSPNQTQKHTLSLCLCFALCIIVTVCAFKGFECVCPLFPFRIYCSPLVLIFLLCPGRSCARVPFFMRGGGRLTLSEEKEKGELCGLEGCARCCSF